MLSRSLFIHNTLVVNTTILYGLVHVAEFWTVLYLIQTEPDLIVNSYSKKCLFVRMFLMMAILCIMTYLLLDIPFGAPGNTTLITLFYFGLITQLELWGIMSAVGQDPTLLYPGK